MSLLKVTRIIITAIKMRKKVLCHFQLTLEITKDLLLLFFYLKRMLH